MRSHDTFIYSLSLAFLSRGGYGEVGGWSKAAPRVSVYGLMVEFMMAMKHNAVSGAMSVKISTDDTNITLWWWRRYSTIIIGGLRVAMLLWPCVSVGWILLSNADRPTRGCILSIADQDECPCAVHSILGDHKWLMKMYQLPRGLMLPCLRVGENGECLVWISAVYVSFCKLKYLS